jgi:hypothetical protein
MLGKQAQQAARKADEKWPRTTTKGKRCALTMAAGRPQQVRDENARTRRRASSKLRRHLCARHTQMHVKFGHKRCTRRRVAPCRRRAHLALCAPNGHIRVACHRAHLRGKGAARTQAHEYTCWESTLRKRRAKRTRNGRARPRKASSVRSPWRPRRNSRCMPTARQRNVGLQPDVAESSAHVTRTRPSAAWRRRSGRRGVAPCHRRAHIALSVQSARRAHQKTRCRAPPRTAPSQTWRGTTQRTDRARQRSPHSTADDARLRTGWPPGPAGRHFADECSWTDHPTDSLVSLNRDIASGVHEPKPSALTLAQQKNHCVSSRVAYRTRRDSGCASISSSAL